MNLEPDKEAKIEVTQCECDLMIKGDCIYTRGPMINKEKSDNICVTALTGIYPWVMTARFGEESRIQPRLLQSIVSRKVSGFQYQFDLKQYRLTCPAPKPTLHSGAETMKLGG